MILYRKERNEDVSDRKPERPRLTYQEGKWEIPFCDINL